LICQVLLFGMRIFLFSFFFFLSSFFFFFVSPGFPTFPLFCQSENPPLVSIVLVWELATVSISPFFSFCSPLEECVSAPPPTPYPPMFLWATFPPRPQPLFCPGVIVSPFVLLFCQVFSIRRFVDFHFALLFLSEADKLPLGYPPDFQFCPPPSLHPHLSQCFIWLECAQKLFLDGNYFSFCSGRSFFFSCQKRVDRFPVGIFPPPCYSTCRKTSVFRFERDFPFSEVFPCNFGYALLLFLLRAGPPPSPLYGLSLFPLPKTLLLENPSHGTQGNLVTFRGLFCSRSLPPSPPGLFSFSLFLPLSLFSSFLQPLDAFRAKTFLSGTRNCSCFFCEEIPSLLAFWFCHGPSNLSFDYPGLCATRCASLLFFTRHAPIFPWAIFRSFFFLERNVLNPQEMA